MLGLTRLHLSVMNGPPPELPPISAPVRRRWREFRIRVLPWIVFAGLATLAGFLWEDALLPKPVQPQPANCEPNCSDASALQAPGRLDTLPSGSAALTLSNYPHRNSGSRD